MQTNHISALQQLLKRYPLVTIYRFWYTTSAACCDNFHAHRPSDERRLLADLTESDQPHCLAS
ncbi:hypothetical protein D3C86_2167330 [compost metagenome]